MKKLIFLFIVAASVLFLGGCLKSGGAPAGAAGATGTTGAPGQSLPLSPITVLLSPGSMRGGPTATLSWLDYTYLSYDSNYTYLLTVSLNKQGTKEWYPSPMYNVYVPGDEIYANIGHDTIKILYYNPSSNGWPDSTVVANIYLLPIPPPQNKVH